MSTKGNFDFATDLDEANQISDLTERLLFWRKREKEFNQQPIGMSWGPYKDQLHEEIRFIQDVMFYQGQKPSHPSQGSNIEPIWWMRSDRLLCYLVEKLKQRGLIHADTQEYKLIKEHFVKKDRSPYTDSIKQNDQGAASNKTNKPKGFEQIDQMLDEMAANGDLT